MALGRATLGDTITWSWAECGVVCFTPTISISSMPIAKRRHFGRFCLTLVFNFPSFLYQPASPGTLVLYRVRFVGLRSGYLIPGATCYHTGFRVTCPVHFFVGSMAEIDTVASRIGGSPVQFVDHLALTRIVQPWAGHQQWIP